MFRFMFGALFFTLGVLQAGFIIYNVFIHRLVDEKFVTPLGMICPLGFVAGLLYVGASWMAQGWENLPSFAPRKKKAKAKVKTKLKKRPALDPLDD